MPELPEVEVVRRGLAHHLPGRTITGYQSSTKPLRRKSPDETLRQLLVGARIEAIRRRAKFLLID
ncbi:MAG: DNA-formamidopyrimidine glycosylase family protein, partial [Desulfofustis sp.]|nr:DNA-formamidopyrimidine glycosylase family protein [Desulfofustis sp.]